MLVRKRLFHPLVDAIAAALTDRPVDRDFARDVAVAHWRVLAAKLSLEHKALAALVSE